MATSWNGCLLIAGKDPLTEYVRPYGRVVPGVFPTSSVGDDVWNSEALHFTKRKVGLQRAGTISY
jgi:hypothetical protein